MSNLGIHIKRKRPDGKVFKVQAKNSGDKFSYLIYNQDDKLIEESDVMFTAADSAVSSGLRRIVAIDV